MQGRDVTLVVVPRERFSVARRALESVLANTRVPYRLLYVDAGGPPDLATWLDGQAETHGFEVLRSPTFLRPNQARNRALREVETTWVAFLDNDVVVHPGWLDALLTCGAETGAAIVGPATLMGSEREAVVHILGGDLEVASTNGHRLLTETHRHAHEQFGAAARHRERCACDLAEFHGMLVRRDLFDRIGLLDERFVLHKEHTDLCLAAKAVGASIWYEPRAMITYLTEPALTLDDVPFFRFRWDVTLERDEHAHAATKWEVDPSSSALTGAHAFSDAHRELELLPRPDLVASDTDVPRKAQTPAQLLMQLEARGASVGELARTRAACDLAISMYAGLHRACGTPMLCHGVGTASILLSFGAPVPLALAGLLHAAYSHGLFDAGPAGPSYAHRDRVRQIAGPAVEALVHAYDQHKPAACAPPDPTAPLEAMPCREAAVHVLRIANDLDERIDGAVGYTAKTPDAIAAWRPFFRRLTAHLGVPQLALALDAAIERSAACADAVPASVRSAAEQTYLIEDRTREALHPSTRRAPAPPPRPRTRKTLASRVRDEWRRLRRRLRRTR
ncbi:MAG: glycosyltransferase [Planctomycetota bacterium]|nr:glycosyltransferase [Planctomycetota bacterium]